jgi:hypothetical protein
MFTNKFFGLLIIFVSIITFLYENYKENNLVPVKCLIKSFDCSSRAAKVEFYYDGKLYSEGGTPSIICENYLLSKKLLSERNLYYTFYFYENDKSFYFNNSTRAYLYLYFTFFGIIIFFYAMIKPFLVKLVLNVLRKIGIIE